jgi:KipI family sensor histidine kinase inhibitor
MTRAVPPGEIRLLGDRGLLVGVDDTIAARALARRLGDEFEGRGLTAAEVVCGFATVGVVLADATADATDAGAAVDLDEARDVVGEVLAGGVFAEPDAETTRVVTVPCAFDGLDLGDVAEAAGCTAADVVAHLTAAPLRVSVLGFAPGFAYLEGLPSALAAVPRRAVPRPSVPAGSVALANGHAAVYPTATPGGWQLVGRTGYPLLTSHPPYALLAPGDRVRFVVAGAGDPVDPPRPGTVSWAPPSSARPVLTVAAPGLRAVRQDGGRARTARAGIPHASAADPVSFALANLLVGNAPNATALELTGGGTRLRCEIPCHVALAGADPELRVDGATVPGGQVLPLEPGQTLAVGPLRRGCRTYLAVAGGLLGPSTFGSTASDELCRLGPGPLAAGDTLWAASWQPPLGDHLRNGAASEIGPGETATLRVLPGPHPEHFRHDALDVLADTVFTVHPDSNRVGLRLQWGNGTVPLRAGADAPELDSHCVVTGAVQVPPGGDPVVLLPDHATLGGYPVVAVVTSADLGLLGQCAPGTAVRLARVSAEEADAARRLGRRQAASAVMGHYPLQAG